MHRIVKSHLQSFATEFGVENDDESVQFEKFCNFCFVHPRIAGKLDPDERNKEAIYYSSALVLYRIHLLTSSGAVTSNARKFKWHILPLVGALVAGKEIHPLNSRKVEAYAAKVVDLFHVQSDQINETLAKAVDIVIQTDNVSSDRRKRQAALDEMLEVIA